MDHSAAVRVADRVAHVEEAGQKLSQRQGTLARILRTARTVKSRNGVLQRLPANEPHGVERAAVGVNSQSVHRHDPGMLQFTGYFCFENEPCTQIGTRGDAFLQLFQRDLSPQPFVLCDKHRANAAASVGAENAKSAHGSWLVSIVRKVGAGHVISSAIYGNLTGRMGKLLPWPLNPTNCSWPKYSFVNDGTLSCA